MKSLLDERLPLIVHGEPYRILSQSADKPMLLRHVDDASRIIAMTDVELLVGLTNSTIRLAYVRNGTRIED